MVRNHPQKNQQIEVHKDMVGILEVITKIRLENKLTKQKTPERKGPNAKNK